LVAEFEVLELWGFSVCKKDMRIANKVALITGASRGIGRAVAERFAKEGARLFLTGLTDEAALQASIAAVRTIGAEAHGGLFDVRSYNDVRRMADQAERRFGTVDILVNNAGTIKPTPLLEITPEQWDATIRTHLCGAFYCTREIVTRFMKQQRSGKIINVTSPAALRASHGVADYGSAKAGVVMLTRSAARELAEYNIQVNAVLPVVGTRMTDAMLHYYRDKFGAESAARFEKLSPPDVVVPAFLFFATSDSDYVTGSVLTADGGMLA
jgi:3-oxoacyl-[acyl-carrier protein] reductase